MKRNQKWAAAVLASVAVLLCSVSAFAGEWKQNDVGYWWQEADGSYPVSCWKWLDGNRDGVAECYYFDASGYMAANSTVEGQYTVNGDGQWTVNGIVQTQSAPASQTEGSGRPVAEYYKYLMDEDLYFWDGNGLYFGERPAPLGLLFLDDNSLLDCGDYYEITGQTLSVAIQYDSPQDLPGFDLVSIPNGKYVRDWDDGGLHDDGSEVVYEGSLYVNKDAVVLFHNGAPPDGITRYESVDAYLAENEHFYRVEVRGYDENGYITRLYTINAG